MGTMLSFTNTNAYMVFIPMIDGDTLPISSFATTTPFPVSSFNANQNLQAIQKSLPKGVFAKIV